MFKCLVKRFLVVALSAGLIGTGLPPTVYAGMLGTETMVHAEEREARIASVEAALARDDVRTQMERFGLDADLAIERVAALSDHELQTLSGNIENLPAGAGVLGVIGAVIVVLVVLDLLGVTNVFPRI